MYDIEDVLAVAEEVRSHLPELIGTAAAQVDARLSDLLRRSESGADVKSEILELFAEYEPLRVWAAEALTLSSAVRGYRPPPGTVQDTGIPRYVCAQGHIAFRLTLGDPVPSVCPRCGSRFEPADPISS